MCEVLCFVKSSFKHTREECESKRTYVFENWITGVCSSYVVSLCEGRRPVGRPRKTWLESVEADMAELEIDKEDVHARSKWRRNVNVMKRKSNPIGKRTINR